MTNSARSTIQQAHSLVSQGKLVEARGLVLDRYAQFYHDAEIQLGLGVIDAREGVLAGAERWLRNAVEADPDKPGIHVHLANTLSRAQKTDEAISRYQIAISTAPDIFEAHLYLAGLLLSKKLLEDEKHHFLYAIRLKPDHPDGDAIPGQVYELLYQPKGTRSSAGRPLELKSDPVGALMRIGKLEKRNGNFAEAEKAFRDVLAFTSGESLVASVSIKLEYVLDGLGRYDDAWDAFLRGIMAWSRIAEIVPFDKQECQRRIQINTQLFSGANVGQWIDGTIPDDFRPAPVFFVGCHRSGTTLVEQIPGQHPDIITSNEKPFLEGTMQEISAKVASDRTFSDYFSMASSQDILRIRNTYWRRVESSLGSFPDRSLLIDKLPYNIVELGYVARKVPVAHMLIAIRDPRDVCLSCATQAFKLNPVKINFLSMKSTVAFYVQIMKLWLHYRSVLPINWYQYRYDNLVTNFHGTIEKIFAFLGMDPSGDLDKFHAAPRDRLINTPSCPDVTTTLYSLGTGR